jgi:tetratricopeptide (TPR) repeat protein
MEPILSRALAREPGHRYQSASAFAYDLGQVRSQYETTTAAEPALTATAVQPTVILPAAGQPRRWIAAAVLTVTVVAIAAIGLRGSWLRSAAPIEGVVTPAADAPSREPASTTPALSEPNPTAKPPAPAVVATAPPSPAAAERPGATTTPTRPAVNADDGRIAARLTAAKSAEESGDFDAAIAHYQEVLAANPAHAAAAEGLSAARRQQSRAREAAIKGRIAEGEQKLADGAYDDAIAMFESVLTRDAGNLEALDGVARARKAKAAEEAIFKSRLKKPPGFE